MNGIAPLLKSILGKDDISACGLSELQSLARQYPYFAPLHLLLAEKIKTLDEDLYEQQLEKVSLYIHQPLWLHYLLNQGNFNIEVLEKEEVSQETILPVIPVAEKKVDHELKENSEHLSSVNEMENQEIANSVQNETEENETLNQEIETNKPENEIFHSTEENEINQATLKEDENIVNEIANTVQNEPAEIEGENNLPDERLIEGNTIQHTDSKMAEKTAADHFIIPVEDEDDDEGTFQDESDLPPLHIPSLRIEQLKETGKDLLFEPYHTVDYFASQGIKNQAEGLPKDRFSHQLKSFTEWLKSMKKLPDDAKENQLDAGSEEKVQTLATHSIAENEILTETMAEVWLKQGDPLKAAEVYHKLSLQNPSKSHYFAAKIESLNTQ